MAELQENAFLKLGSIKGKATSDKFKDLIVFQSMSYGLTQAGEWEDGDKLSGRITTFADVCLVKEMDMSSPALAQASATKEQFDKAEISLAAAGKDTFLKITLEKVILTSVSVGFSSGEARPTETISMSSKKQTWEWGTAKGGYDLDKNAKV